MSKSMERRLSQQITGDKLVKLVTENKQLRIRLDNLVNAYSVIDKESPLHAENARLRKALKMLNALDFKFVDERMEAGKIIVVALKGERK